MELLQFIGQILADEIRTRAEQLPQLDERRSQFGEGQADAGFARQPGDALAVRIAELILGKVADAAIEGRAAKESGAGAGTGVAVEDFARAAQAGVEAGTFSAAPEDTGAEDAAPTITTISATAQAAAEAPAQE